MRFPFGAFRCDSAAMKALTPLFLMFAGPVLADCPALTAIAARDAAGAAALFSPHDATCRTARQTTGETLVCYSEHPFRNGAATALAAGVAVLALRTIGVAFMIVTLMFAQAGFLTILYFGEWTRGDEGFVLQREVRQIAGLDLADPVTRYLAAWLLFSAALLATARMMHVAFGGVLVAIRENEERTRMLGYNVFAHKFAAVVISGAVAGAAGAAYGLLFGYVGATFASVQYSIFPLLWVLLGGAGTTIGPLIGAVFMFYLIDYSSGLTSAYMLVAGVVLVLLTLFARAGIAGEIRRRWAPWLP